LSPNTVLRFGSPEEDKRLFEETQVLAEQGYAYAQNNLGLMYDLGEGVPKDNVRAYMWVNIAGANGQDEEKVREILTDQMSQADIAKAQEKTT
jgi:uncharacterized protein